MFPTSPSYLTSPSWLYILQYKRGKGEEIDNVEFAENYCPLLGKLKLLRETLPTTGKKYLSIFHLLGKNKLLRCSFEGKNANQQPLLGKDNDL